MTKREAELKSAFFRELRAQLPTFYTLQFSTAGAPDRVIIGAGHITLWEFKHGTPVFESPGHQELLCMRLDQAAGHCRYVIWQENRHGAAQRTLIVTPKHVHTRDGWHVIPEDATTGFNHKWLVNQVKRAHGL